MSFVLVLTSDGPLSDERAEAILRSVEGESGGKARIGAMRRLARDAVEVACEGDAAIAVEAARSAASDDPIDANVVPSANRAKRLLICDMDSTIIPVECIDEIADFAGVGPRVAAITERAMRGELDFDGALRERVGLLKGLRADVLQQVYEERVSLNPGAAEMVAGMNAAGALTALVSGGFTFFTERVAQAAGFSRNQANTLTVEDGLLTGAPGDPILGKQAKLDALLRLTSEIGAAPTDAVAVGDGANDLAMIEAAGLGVAYRAKPAVAAADSRLDYIDLTAVLRLQGVPAADFA